MSRALRAARTLPGPSRVRALHPAVVPLQRLSRAASTRVPQAPLPTPPDAPVENYAEPASYTFSLIGRTIKYLVYGGVGLSLAAYLTFEGGHAYIERVALAPPSRASEDDTYAWADENQAWTGGEKGGTDPRLGWKGRHALRGAWVCWEWGAGEGGAIGKTPARHPNMRGGMIGTGPTANRIDRGFELAEEYIDSAIAVARAKGIEFPPELAHVRVSPPERTGAIADPTALDLLLLKAGVLERIATPDSLSYARDLYERVLCATEGGSPVRDARIMRLAHKLGDLAQRAGQTQDAQKWWSWGLERVGVALPSTHVIVPSTKRSWWSWGSSRPSNTATETPTTTLAPPVQRAATSILISASAAAAQQGTSSSLSSAAALQALALSLLPPPTTPSVASSSDAPAALHTAWAESRGALLDLHSGSVAHAQKDKSSHPLNLVSQSTERAEAVLSTLTPILPTALTAPNSNPCAQPAKRLLRDTLMTAAEAYFTLAALLERDATAAGKKGDTEGQMHRLEHAGESYERAMSLSAAEEGQTQARNLGDEDAVGRSEEWMRYWRGYVRVRDRLIKAAEAKQ